MLLPIVIEQRIYVGRKSGVVDYLWAFEAIQDDLLAFELGNPWSQSWRLSNQKMKSVYHRFSVEWFHLVTHWNILFKIGIFLSQILHALVYL